MKYTLQIQQSGIEEAVRARYAMVIPIFWGMLNSAKIDIVEQAGGYEKITLEMFARVYIESPGDYGICFEYAVHESLRTRHATLFPYVSQVMNEFTGIKGEAASILFGAEKSGRTHILESVKDALTDDSRLLSGAKAQPPKLKRYIDGIAKAFRSEPHRLALPASIRGLWKADLFIGNTEQDRWVATTLKTRRQDLEAAPGLRIGMFPEERRGQGPSRDNKLILCPLPYSGDFMQLFGASFSIAKQIIAHKGKQPSRAALVYDDDQQVAKWLCDRAHFPLAEILRNLEPLKQPGLLKEEVENVPDGKSATEATAPIPLVLTG
jgi:hypothetical protein